MQLFADTCASGTISGTIKDAVSNSGVANVALSARSGVDTTRGTIVQTTTSDVSGNYSLSSMSTGWYTIQTGKSGYTATTFNVFASVTKVTRMALILQHLAADPCALCCPGNRTKIWMGTSQGQTMLVGGFTYIMAKRDFTMIIPTST